MPIPIIDLFAGPGGLGEGFMSLKNEEDKSIFDIKLSIEKDENAHKTLTWRSFFRQFDKANKPIPKAYYKVYTEPDLKKREELIESTLDKFPEGKIARNEARLIELGSEKWPKDIVDKLISRQLGHAKDWVLIGGPPCQAYSLVGRSRRQWKDNLDNEDVRVHLYKEYLRIIAIHNPAVFVMENVKGLLSSKVEGVKMFDLIKSDLQDPSKVFSDSKFKYRLYSLTTEAPESDEFGQPIYKSDSDYLIRCEEYGIPQKRHRVVILGVREDLDVVPNTLTKSQKIISLKSVIGDLPKVRSGINRSFIKSEIVKNKKKRFYNKEVDSDENWLQLTTLFRNEIISWNGFAKDYGTNKMKVPVKGVGSEFVKCLTPSKSNPLYNWFKDEKIKGAANHESRTHLVQDLKRYMFSSMFAKTYKRFPRLHEFEAHSRELLPDHENANSGKFADRFRVQLANEPATTVTSHISKDGHYFIHYDPNQCRSLTVREAARIQTFPDNYLFCGSRTAQYHQVGNAVPPYLAKQIAEIVLTIFEECK